ncbi:hypothetical protein OIE61_01635 [Streptomyces sp. NBC_01762]|nr:hypothetical protein [Streptomyces sp. NBC_01762]WSC42803.1 hypothetical protein OIE61_01635 [Streptomyces sp. NBC_01762]
MSAARGTQALVASAEGLQCVQPLKVTMVEGLDELRVAGAVVSR